MSSYHSSFKYLDKRSDIDFGWIVTHFSDSADHGETDTFLSTTSVYSDSYDGTRQKFYGTKYDSVASPQITVIKRDGSDFSVTDTRKALSWLTGARQSSWMDFYVGDEVKYRLLGYVKSVSQYKLDARIVGLVITFESISPYGYSSEQIVNKTISGKEVFTIQCDSDDLYSYVNMNTVYTNTSGDSLIITNNTTGDVTKVGGLSNDEVVTISDNMMITSSIASKTFGNTFNFEFPRLKPGDNEFIIEGTGNVEFKYITPVKLGDIAIDINAISDPICDDSGNIQIDMLDWSRVTGTPSTLSGYGIKNAYTKAEVDSMLENIEVKDVYTKAEVDKMLENVVVDDVYTKTEIDYMFANIDVPSIDTYTKAEIDEKFANIDISNIDTYTKSEIDEKLSNITASGVDINEEELNAMLEEVLV